MIMYEPPDSSLHLHQNFTNALKNIIFISANENKELIITDDLNCDFLIPKDHKVIKDIFVSYDLKQIIDSPTRITINTRTLIDIVLTTQKNNIANHIVTSLSLSDHELIGISRKLHVQKFQQQKILC